VFVVGGAAMALAYDAADAVIAWLYTARVISGDAPLPIPGLREWIPSTTVENIHGGLNVQMLHQYTERERATVLGKLHSCVDEILCLTADEDPARTASWLGGSRLPPPPAGDRSDRAGHIMRGVRGRCWR
jgi:hypothetical protein